MYKVNYQIASLWSSDVATAENCAEMMRNLFGDAAEPIPPTPVTIMWFQAVYE